MAVDCEIVDEMRHVVQEELHQIEEAHGLHKVEQIITFIGLLLMIAGVMVGLDAWATIPPVAAEVVKSIRKHG